MTAPSSAADQTINRQLAAYYEAKKKRHERLARTEQPLYEGLRLLPE